MRDLYLLKQHEKLKKMVSVIVVLAIVGVVFSPVSATVTYRVFRKVDMSEYDIFWTKWIKISSDFSNIVILSRTATGQPSEDIKVTYFAQYGSYMEWEKKIGKGGVEGFEISRNGSRIIVGYYNPTSAQSEVYIFNKNGELINSLQPSMNIDGLAISPDGKYLVIAEGWGELQNGVWVAKGRLSLYEIQSHSKLQLWNYKITSSRFKRVFFSKDGKYIIAIAGKSNKDSDVVYLFSREDGYIWRYPTNAKILGIAISDNNEYITIMDKNGAIQYVSQAGYPLWKGDFVDGKIIVAFSVDGNADYITIATQKEIYIINKEGQIRRIIKLPYLEDWAKITTIDISHDGKYIVCGTNSGGLYIYTTGGILIRYLKLNEWINLVKIREDNEKIVIATRNEILFLQREILGTVIVDSNPQGASVYINNNYLGKTPLNISLRYGTYEVKIKKNGYDTFVTNITVSSEISKTINITLTPRFGYITINSKPPGAYVYLDNKTYLGTTPLVKYKLPVGIHNITLMLTGYQQYSKTVNIEVDKTEHLVVRLKEIPPKLKIVSHPANASVYINYEKVGVTPLNVTLSPGEYFVRISKEGYLNFTTTLYLNIGDEKDIVVDLIPNWGFLSIYSNVKGAKIYIDNKEIGEIPLKNYNISAGTHLIEIKADGYKAYSRYVQIEPAKTLTINAELEPIHGFLNVYSNVQGAEVYLDGKPIGKTPLKEYKLSAGKHTIEVKANGYEVFSQNITIEPTKTLTVNARLLPPPTQTASLQQHAKTFSTIPSQPQTFISTILATFYSYIPPSYLPYAGASLFGLFALTLIVFKKRRKKPLVPSFPPQLLKKYEPLEFLGEGGFAKVFKVKRKRDKKIIALKVFPKDEKARKFFTKEVRAWKLLDHPNIVKLYNAFEEPLPHLEIEFIEGYNLDGKLIRDLEHYPKPVNEKLALRFIEGIAEGLRHAHSKKVYHRDLKPSNILLKSDLTPKITDFGLAKVGSKSTTTTTKALTPLYAAPEQIDERTYGHTDHRTDIYQLGIILYELLTGKLPYEGSSHAVVLAKITNPEIKPKPPSLYNLTLAKYDRMFEKLLAKQKEERYQSLDEFLDEFRGLVKLIKEREKLRESLKVTKDTISQTKDELEIKKLNSELVRLLTQNAVLSARINDKAEVLNALYDLVPFTKKHRAELEAAIKQIQLLIQEELAIPESFIDVLKILMHKIERENR